MTLFNTNKVKLKNPLLNVMQLHKKNTNDGTLPSEYKYCLYTTTFLKNINIIL